MRSSIERNRRFFCGFLVAIGVMMLCCVISQLAFAVELEDPADEEPEAGYLYQALLAPAPGQTELKYAPYIGSGYFVCSTAYGDVYIYVPIDTKGKWGTTNNGYLCNVSSSSISGIMFDSEGKQYTFSAPGFSLPRYRLTSSTSYTYTDLLATVKSSNLDPATDFPADHGFADMYQYIFVGMMGVIILCLMRSKR